MVFFSLLPYTTIFDAIPASRKSAFWWYPLTEKRTLHASGHADCAFPSRWDRVDAQTALFRHDAATECAFA